MFDGFVAIFAKNVVSNVVPNIRLANKPFLDLSSSLKIWVY